MTGPDDTADILRDTDLFAGLDDDRLAALAARSVPETLRRRASPFFAGDPPDGLRIVTRGLLRVWINDDEGREVTLTLVEPGEVLGELALLDGATRSANVTAMEETRTLLIRQASFNALLAEDPGLQRHIIALLCGRLRRLTDDLGHITLLTLRRRLARKLHELAQSHAVPEGEGARFRRQFSQSDLAAMLGVTREAVNKQLAALTADGLVRVEGGTIRIADLGRLEAEG